MITLSSSQSICSLAIALCISLISIYSLSGCITTIYTRWPSFRKIKLFCGVWNKAQRAFNWLAGFPKSWIGQNWENSLTFPERRFWYCWMQWRHIVCSTGFMGCLHLKSMQNLIILWKRSPLRFQLKWIEWLVTINRWFGNIRNILNEFRELSYPFHIPWGSEFWLDINLDRINRGYHLKCLRIEQGFYIHSTYDNFSIRTYILTNWLDGIKQRASPSIWTILWSNSFCSSSVESLSFYNSKITYQRLPLEVVIPSLSINRLVHSN